MRTETTLFPPALESKIVRCIEEAVGNDILEDTRKADLAGTQNSVPSRIWDLINRNLLRTIDVYECAVSTAKTGPWQMLVIHERSTRCIITFMREKRFRDVQRYQPRRRRMHYLDALTAQFNAELLVDREQLALFPHSFDNEDQLAELVQSLLRNLQGNAEVINNHVLVLFETAGSQLTHVRAVKVTPTLEIAKGCEWDWSMYISGATNAIVDTVDQVDAPENQPARGLSLKSKAIARKKNNLRNKNAEDAERNGS